MRLDRPYTRPAVVYWVECGNCGDLFLDSHLGALMVEYGRHGHTNLHIPRAGVLTIPDQPGD